VSEWISVKEKLPDKSGNYVAAYGNSERRYVCQIWAQLHGDGSLAWQWDEYEGGDEDDLIPFSQSHYQVTHWMPLPEPPAWPPKQKDAK